MSDDEDLGLGEVFPEEERPPTPPLDVKYYTRPNGQQLSIQLAHKHSLWGHVLYPTSIYLSDYLASEGRKYVNGKNVLEFGAGGGLPSLISALEGANKVVVTDYPDIDLVSNLRRNIEVNIPEGRRTAIAAVGYVWGTSSEKLLEHLASEPSNKCFDTILAADLVFNHSQHLALIKSCERCLAGSSDPVLLCFYSHHRPTPVLIEKDLSFINLAKERGWTVVEKLENPNAGPAFPEDKGDLAIRSTVHGWILVPPNVPVPSS